MKPHQGFCNDATQTTVWILDPKSHLFDSSHLSMGASRIASGDHNCVLGINQLTNQLTTDSQTAERGEKHREKTDF